MKFMNPDKFYETITQWVRDGSTVVDIVGSTYGVWVTLTGKDGAKEDLVLWHEQRDFDFDADRISGDE